MTSRATLLIALAGTGLTAAASLALGIGSRDTLELAAYSLGGACGAAALGAASLHALRRASVGIQVAIVALTAVAAVAAGAVAAALRMFLSDHDLRALLVVLCAGGTAGAVIAVLLAGRVRAESLRLQAAARRIGREREAAIELPHTAELASLGRELDDVGKRLNESRARERALDRARRDLVAWVSHDLRTPLAGIRAMAEALVDGVVEDAGTVARYHVTMRAEAERLAGLVDDLFELSRIHAGALRLQPERVSLSDLVSDAIAAAMPAARSKGIMLDGRVGDGPLDVDVSVPEMLRALRNILENAVRHTPSDGTVWVATGSDGTAAFVTVADACGGIAPSDLPHVFEPGFRAGAARTPGGGSGLGLSIARGIVEAHHGRIVVRNEGPGCRFTVRLPVGAA